MNKFTNKLNTNKGFTLIELLVVIAIIGLLSTLAVISFINARENARDSKRMSDLKQLQLAIELYNYDYGYYPKESEGASGKIGEGTASLNTMLIPYMPVVPMDPLGPRDPDYYYYYDGSQECTVGGTPNSIAVIFAHNMELASGNASNFCDTWEGEGGAGGFWSLSYSIR